MLVIFSLKNVKQGHKLELQCNIFVCLLYLAYETSLANMKMECQRWPEMPVMLGRSGSQYVTMVTKLVSSYC